MSAAYHDFMSYLEALLYGAVQGITEYLPISSSAHLILIPKFLKHDDPGLTFDVFLHLGTLMATVLYFWKDWLGILRTIPGLRGRSQVTQATDGSVISWKLIVIATLPALMAGALLHQWVETVFRGTHVLIVTLVAGGLLLYGADALCSRKRLLHSARANDALWVGIAQCFALVPGVSRSGSTMMGGRLLGFDRTAAARFSFLISAPITAAALIFELRNWNALLDSPIGIGPLMVAGVSSFAFGCLAIGGLLRLLRRFGYLSFAVYRVLLAIVIFIVL
jgi:undecaprenyl-diphosphatase